jgi:hypothetical protein
MAIRYVVAGEGRLPELAAARLGEQMDLDLVQRAGGLWIYRNARVLPPAAILPGEAAVAAARSSSLLAPLGVDPAVAVPVHGRAADARGTAPEGGVSLLFLADRFDPAWSATSATGEASPFAAFGWGLGFEVGPGPVKATFEGAARRVGELVGLGLAWAVALWIVRRTSRDEHRPEQEPAPLTPAELAAEPNLSRT